MKEQKQEGEGGGGCDVRAGVVNAVKSQKIFRCKPPTQCFQASLFFFFFFFFVDVQHIYTHSAPLFMSSTCRGTCIRRLIHTHTHRHTHNQTLRPHKKGEDLSVLNTGLECKQARRREREWATAERLSSFFCCFTLYYILFHS